MKLYSYPRSSASYRVRIALHLKAIPVEVEDVNLLQGEQRDPDYLLVNPQGVLPTLVDGEIVISQSLAAIEYLEERYPRPALLPRDAKGRARVRQLALIIACEIHPLQNLGVLRSLAEQFDIAEEGRRGWARQVIERGLEAFSKIIEQECNGPYCHGAELSMADLLLIPQLYNARRFNCDLRRLSRLLDIEAACLRLDAFTETSPDPAPRPPAESSAGSA